MDEPVPHIPEPFASQIKERGRAKCLSIQQPWATIIVKGKKDIEMRTWATPYRGPMIICSGKTPRDSGIAGYRHEPKREIISHGSEVWPAPRGVAIALVELLDCRTMAPKEFRRALVDYEPGADFIGWFVRVIQPLPPVPIKGSLGLFEIGLDHEVFTKHNLLG